MKPCAPLLDAAELPNRGAVVLAREARALPLKVLAAEGQLKSSPDGALQRLTMSFFADVFKEANGVKLPPGCFLAGRCTPPKEADFARLDSWLGAVVSSLDVAALRAMAPSYVEAAMSIGLRGDIARSHTLLAEVAGEGGIGSTHDWLGAFYLAQHGDPAGWPAMLAALQHDEHTRLMASRHLFIFTAFDGQSVGTDTVDVRARLIERLDDDTDYVAVEVPGLLAEAGVDGVEALLADAAKSAAHEAVRGAATDVLAQVRAAN